MNNKVTVIVPSRNEPFLNRTLQDLLNKAGGEIEIIAIIDEHWPKKPIEDPRIIYLHPDNPEGMRRGINRAAKHAGGKWLMKIDAHCIVDDQYDIKLKESCEDNWVVVPRRHDLDDVAWEKLPRYHDYGYFIYPRKFRPMTLTGWEWPARDKSRRAKKIDENLSFQGSCWFMTRDHFYNCGLLEVDGYHGLPHQESTEISLKTWYAGGKVMVNKKTWYAHLHKGQKHYRGYPVGGKEVEDCCRYAYRTLVSAHHDEFIKLIERFWPIPNWPEWWRDRV